MSLAGCISKLNAGKEVFTSEEVSRLKLAVLQFKKDGGANAEKMAVQAELDTLMAERQEIADAIKNTPHFVQLRIAKALEGKVSKPAADKTDGKVGVQPANEVVQVEQSANADAIAGETYKGVARFSRRIHGERPAVHDYIVPETPEFDGDMSGDLAYTPQSAEEKGIDQLPIRLTVGVATAPHRGFGIEHIADNSQRDSNRAVPVYTKDEHENYARHVAMLARNFNEIYTDGNELILRYNNEALVVRQKSDPVTQGNFYSVITIRPASNNVWGNPVWAGREYFPDDRLQQPRASTLSPDQESLRSDRIPQRNQTSHYDGTQVKPDRQPKNKPTVTTKKRRAFTISEVKESQSVGAANNPHTRSTLTAAIDQAFPQTKDFARLLLATGKFSLISSGEIGEHLGEGVRFSQASDQSTTIEVDGVTRPTTNSNGQPIAQTEEGLRNFWRFFGDSKVLDDDGQPLVVYHGTDRDFSEFSPEELGRFTGAESAKKGYFFTDNAENAGVYAGIPNTKSAWELLAKEKAKAEADYSEGQNSFRDIRKLSDEVRKETGGLNPKELLSDYQFDKNDYSDEEIAALKKQIADTPLSIKTKAAHTVKISDAAKAKIDRAAAELNRISWVEKSTFNKIPDIEDFESVSNSDERYLTRELRPNVMPVYLNIKNPLRVEFQNDRDQSFSDLIDEAKNKGYDGAIFKNVNDPLLGDVYVAFERNQIKSSTANTGAFSPTNPDIRYSTDGSRILAFVTGGKTFLVYDNISQTDDNVKGILTHEISLHALTLGRNEPEFQAILKRIETLRKMGDKQIQAARDRVPKGTHADLVLEEQAGYLLENSPDLSISKKLLAWFRTQLRKLGKALPVMQRMKWFKWADSLNTDDIVYMAQQTLKSAPQTLMQAKVIGKGLLLFSKQDGNSPDIHYSKAESLPGIEPTPPATPPRQGGLGLEGGATGSRASWDSLEPSKIDDIIYKLQNKNIDLKRVIAAVKESGAEIADKYNAYLQEELYHGRSDKRTKDFVNHELKPLLTGLTMRGLTIPELEQYLHARHAEEANKLVAERNPDDPELQDGGSGMKTKAAQDYLSSLPVEKWEKLKVAAAQVDAILAKTRGLYESYGLESKDTVDGWGKMFKHYIPLMREDHDGAMGVGQGFSIKGKEVKHRTGSTSQVIDILANIALQREKVIVRGEKNRVAVALAGLAKLNPNPDFWTFDKVQVERVLNEKTGLVEERTDPMFRSRDNVIVAKIRDTDGSVHERAVVFNESNPRAVRMAQAMKNLDAAQMEGLLGVSAKITRYFAAINTQYNIIFGVVNLVRDIQGSLINLSSTPIAGHQKEMVSHIIPALRGVYAATRAATKGNETKSIWADLWEEMQNEGGMTGYRDLYRNSEDRADAIKHALDPHSWHDSNLGKIFTAGGMLKVPLSVAQDKATWIFDWLSDYNQTMEGATRLSVYKTALDNGMNKAQAASLAKNISVNFNRKGQAGQQAGALYAFFNAAMQGSARIGETLTTMDKGNIKTLRLSSFGAKAISGGIMLGSMQALLLLAAGFDEDEPPEFIRERNLILPIGNKKYLTVPMPLGFHAIPNIGRIPTEFVMGGFKSPGDHVLRLVGVFAEAFNPLGSSGVSIQTIAPTAIDPLVALSENKDWTGKPIARKDFNSMSPTPGFTRNKDTASDPSKWLAEAINTLSGGTKYTPGAMSPTADQIDYLFGQVTGGVGRESSKLEQSLMATATGEELPPHKIPLVGRFYGDSGAQSNQGNKFYANLKRINEVEAELKGRRKDKLPVDEYKAENPEYKLIMRANMTENMVSKMRARKRELMEKDAPREQIKAVETRITTLMTGLNQKVKELRQEAVH